MKDRPLSLGFSPCPNDCFIFDALLHAKIDTEGLSFIPIIEDVEKLNKKAINNELDITKLSFFAYGQASNNYVLLDAGSALGFGCGPLVISKNVGCHEEFIQNGENGILLDPFSRNGWAEAILTLLQDAAYRKKIGENGSRTCREQFDIRRVVKKFESLYEELTAR